MRISVLKKAKIPHPFFEFRDKTREIVGKDYQTREDLLKEINNLEIEGSEIKDDTLYLCGLDVGYIKYK